MLQCVVTTLEMGLELPAAQETQQATIQTGVISGLSGCQSHEMSWVNGRACNVHDALQIYR